MGWKKKETGEEVNVKPEVPVPQPKEEPEDKSLWRVGALATETTPVIVNSETGKQLDLYSAIALLLERTEE